MATPASDQVRARVSLGRGGEGTNVATGLSVLDHLLGLLARYGDFELALDVAPGAADGEAAAGRALGEALHAPLRAGRGHGSAVLPSDEALAHVALEASGRPLVVSNVDLSAARVAGLGTDLVARFLDALAEGAGLTLHVRLVHGEETGHVLDAIFKALGHALRKACSPRPAKETQ